MDEMTVALGNPEIGALLDLLRARMQDVLGEKLIGLYVVGSLVVGDFDLDVSDIDLIALMVVELDPDEAESLKAMHAAVAQAYPHWDDRIEVIYAAVENLNARKAAYSLAVISPGEPFHVFEVRGSDWLLNWYVLYENGVALAGAAPRTVIAPVSLDELLPALRQQLPLLREWVEGTQNLHRGAQAYAILTMCRALYTFRRGGFVSKREAALWAAGELPEWLPLIHQALDWRLASRHTSQGGQVDSEATRPETARFVAFVINQIVSNSSI